MKTGIVVALVAALSLPTAAAAATPKIQKAWFRVTVEGVQRESWDNLHPGSGGCDATVASKGSELIKFRSRPVVMEAMWMKGLNNPVLRKAGKEVVLDPFRLSGSITRNSTISVSPTPPQCGGVGGGSIPKDCGTKSFRGLKASVEYSYAKPFEQLQVRSSGGIGDVFKNCGGGTQGYPNLLSTRTDGWPIRSPMPRKELFDKSIGKFIVIGRGQRVQKGDETYDKASIRWEVTLRRVEP